MELKEASGDKSCLTVVGDRCGEELAKNECLISRNGDRVNGRKVKERWQKGEGISC